MSKRNIVTIPVPRPSLVALVDSVSAIKQHIENTTIPTDANLSNVYVSLDDLLALGVYVADGATSRQMVRSDFSKIQLLTRNRD